MSTPFNTNFISTKLASEISGYHPDYISRLCRSGKIISTQIGGSWLVDKDSLLAFSNKQEKQQKQNAEKLSRVREKEYQQAQETRRIEITPRVVAKAAPRSVKSTFIDNAFAVMAALLFGIVSLYSLRIGVVDFVATNGGNIVSNAAQGVRLLAHDIPALSTKEKMATLENEPVVQDYTFAKSITLPQIEINDSDNDFLAISAIRPTQVAIVGSSPKIDFSAVTKFISNPLGSVQDLASLGAHTYIYTGEQTRSQIVGILSSYLESIYAIDQTWIAVGESTRQTLFATAASTLEAEIAIGESVSGISSRIIELHEEVIETYIAAVPEISYSTVSTVYTIGNLVAVITDEFPHVVAEGYEHGITSWVEGSYAVAHQSEEVLLALGRTIYDIDTDLRTAHMAVIEGTGELAYTQVATVVSESTEASQAVATAFTHTEVRNEAEAREAARTSFTSVAESFQATTSGLAASAAQGVSEEVHSFGEKLALHTYHTINDLFYDGLSSVAHLFRPSVAIILPPPVEISSPAGTSSSYSIISQTPIQNIVNQISIQGVTYDVLTQKLAELRRTVSNDIYNSIDNSDNDSGGGSGSVTSVDISGGTTGLTFGGGPITTSGTFTLSGVLDIANGGTGTGTAPAYGELLVGNGSGGYAHIATSSLGISGGASLTGTQGQVAYFSGTDTAVGTSTIFIASNGNVGIGTTSPYAKLSVAGQTVSEYFSATSTTAVNSFPLALFTSATTTNFGINSETFTDLTGTGLSNVGGALTLNAGGDWTGTFDGQEGSYYLNRANHTGTQLASTISDFATAVNTYIHASTTIPKTYTANIWTEQNTFSNLFATNASSTNATTTAFGINSETFTDLTGAGLSNVGGVLTLNATGDWTGTFDGQEGSWYRDRANHTGTQLASTISDFNAAVNAYIHASTTIPKTYTANSFSALQTFTAGIISNALTLGSLNGPLQANNGVVSATTSIGVLYGGTGLTSAPSYGQLLVGNSSGGYTLTATSSLGLQASLTGTQGQVAYFSGTNTAVGTSSLFISPAGYVGVGTTTFSAPLTVEGVDNGYGVYIAKGGLGVGTLGGENGRITVRKDTDAAWPIMLLQNLSTGDDAQVQLFFDRYTALGDLTRWQLASDVNDNSGWENLFNIEAMDSGGVIATPLSLARNGKVGIGSLPAADVELNVSGGDLRVRRAHTGTTDGALYFGDGTDTYIFGGNSADVMAFSVNGSERVRINTLGNVGIGTTSPYAKLSVVGQTVAEYFTATSTTAVNAFPVALFTSATTTNFGINSETFTDLTGTGLSNVAGALTLNATGDWTGTFDGQEGSWYRDRANHTGTQLAATISDFNAAVNAYIHASTTIPKTYTANSFSALQTFTAGIVSNALTLGTLNGPLQANNGVVSATTSIGVLYGGTGLTSAPAYGELLLGNASGGYTLTATSSLGLQTQLTGTQGQVAYFSGTDTAVGTSSLFIASNGNVGIGTTTPLGRVDIWGATSNEATFYATEVGDVGGPGFIFQKARGTLATPTAILATDTLGTLGFGGFDGTSFVTNRSRIAATVESNWSSSVRDSTLIFETTSGTTRGERLRITSTGNVGIGTTTPVSKLQITGTTANIPSSAVSLEQLVIDDTDGGIGVYASESGSIASRLTLGLVNGGTLTNKWGLVRQTASGGDGLLFTFGTNADAAANTANVYFDDGGNVGIGTTTPGEALTVHGGIEVGYGSTAGLSVPFSGTTAFTRTNLLSVGFANSRDTVTFGVPGATGNPYYVFSDGNVGIGTTTPNARLTIGGSSDGLKNFLALWGTQASSDGTATGVSFYNTNGNPSTQKEIAGIAAGRHSNNFGGSLNFFTSDTSGATSTRMFIDSSGNIGIGTTTPGAKLAVQGDLHLTRGPATDNAAVYFGGMTGGATPTYIFGSSGALAFAVNSAERVRFDSSGNVGIGTTTPTDTNASARDIVIQRSGNAGISLIAGTSNSSSLHFGDTGSQIIGRIQYDHSLDAMSLWTNGSQRMTINSSGSVGIGTTTPGYLLDIRTPVNASNGIRVASLDSTTSGTWPFVEVIGSRADGNTTFQGRLAAGFRRTDGTAIASGQKLGSLSFGGQYGTATNFDSASFLYAASVNGVAEGSFTSSTAMPTGLSFKTGSTGESLQSVNTEYGTERMRITSGGSVGIGTTSPYRILSVSTSSNAVAAFTNTTNTRSGEFGVIDAFNAGINSIGSAGIVFQNAGTEVVRIISNNVGIGTTTPALKLTVQDGSDLGIGVFNTSSSYQGWNLVSRAANGDFSLNQIGTAERLRITTSGNVGIGTTTPSQLLTVNGNFRFGSNSIVPYVLGSDSTGLFLTQYTGSTAITTPLRINASATNGLMTLTSVGVGIGTSTPQWLLNPTSATAAQLSLSAGAGVAQWAFRNAGGNFYLATTTVAGTATTTTNALTIIGSTGNVGINDNDPASFLSINLDGADDDTNYGQALQIVRGTSGGQQISFIRTGNSAISLGYLPNSNSFGFGAGNATDASFTPNWFTVSASNAGVGTTTPWGKFSITNTGTTPSFIVEDSASPDTTPFIIDAGGFVGIGTSTPHTSFRLTATDGSILVNHISNDAGMYMGTTGNGGLLQGIDRNNTVARNIIMQQFGGNVAIGTTTAASPLSIGAQAAGGENLRLSPVAGGVEGGQISFMDAAGLGAWEIDNAGGAGVEGLRFFRDKNGENAFTALMITSSGSVGIGTSTPWRKLSVTDTSTQLVTGYDTTRYTQFDTNSVGDLTIDPQGADIFALDENLWVCTGGSCPAGTPAGNGNIIAETAIGVGTSTPAQQLSVAQNLFVGNGGATAMGQATSTFQGDIRILGKLDVSTIDPVYKIDGVKYATYGHSTVGVKEEAMQSVQVVQYNEAIGKYEYVIAFSRLEKASDFWLFYQITDWGDDWSKLVVSLTPGFDGTVSYTKDIATNQLFIRTDKPGEVSVRLVGNRHDSEKWPTVRPDQDDPFQHFTLPGKN